MNSDGTENAHREPAKWLEIATRTLCQPARERICIEIEAHYSESVANCVASGCTKEEASAKALAELGDPSDAAKRFRTMHLTVVEVAWLQNMAKNIWMSVAASAGFASLAVGLFVFHLLIGLSFNTFCCALILVCFAVALVCYYSTRRTAPYSSTMRRVLIAEMMQHTCNAFSL